MHEAVGAIWELIAATNKFVIDVRPWDLARRRQTDTAAEARLRTVLCNLVEALRLIAAACTPFLPGTAAAIAQQLGVDQPINGDWSTATTWGRYPAGASLSPAGILFPKVEPSAPVVHP